MIIATAGHIDHGKTALIKALTGFDTDRLPEEKRRGITVDLGFAYHRVSNDQSLGFVDVPGHEKLVRTMLAGASGVDFVLLVVAADDGVMPQTREHLTIIDLLGIARGMAVLTKIDKVDDARLAAVSAQVHDLLEGSVLAGAVILPVSSQTGDGIAALTEILAAAAEHTGVRRNDGGFRLAIDRAFTLSGAGLVVTGTVHAGRVAVGDRLLLAPHGRDVRVRGLRVQNENATEGTAGQRCALNITGPRLDKADIARGDWIITPALNSPTSRIDVALRVLRSEKKPLRHWTPVHVHLGAMDVCGRIALLEGATLAPGQSGLGQIILDAPTLAFFGDKFVLRDQSAQRTLAGGRVIDPSPPLRNARKPDRLAFLNAFDRADDGAALDALVDVAPGGIDFAHFARVRNLAPTQIDALITEKELVKVATSARVLLFAKTRWTDIRAGVLAGFEKYQIKFPDRFGATVTEVTRPVLPAERPAFSAALDTLVAEKAIVRFGQLLHLPGHAVKLSLEEENLWFEIERMLRLRDTDPPRAQFIAEEIRLSEDEVRPLLEKLGRIGTLTRVATAYFVLPDVIRRLAEAATVCANQHPEAILTVGAFRELTGISRHGVMPMLEFFDRIGFTARHDHGRRMRTQSSAIFGSET